MIHLFFFYDLKSSLQNKEDVASNDVCLSLFHFLLFMQYGKHTSMLENLKSLRNTGVTIFVSSETQPVILIRNSLTTSIFSPLVCLYSKRDRGSLRAECFKPVGCRIFQSSVLVLTHIYFLLVL